MKIKSITAFCLFGLFLCSCNREEVPEGAVTQDTVLHAGLVSVQTRTWLDSEGSKDSPTKKVYWSDGDRINVNGQVSSPVSVQEGEKVSEADFQLRGVEGPYNVVYPHDIVSDKTYDEAGRITISLPSSQRYDATTFASGAAVMYGYSESENVELHNLCAAVRVNLKGTSSVSAATVLSESAAAPVCGTFRLCPQTGELVPVEGETSLSLDFEEDVALSSDGIDFYFTIPAGDYSAGLLFYFTNAGDGRDMECLWQPKDALEPGHLYSFNDVAYAPKVKDIETAEEWEEFVLALEGEGDLERYVHKNGVVRLGADIEADDLTSVTTEFKYTFDGNGKTITRKNATKALFSTVSGEVKNLTLAGTLALTDEGAPLVNTLADGGKITACTNKMAVTFEAADHAYVGGLVKIMQGGTVEGCKNEGAITVNLDLSSADKNTAVAGIVAQINASTNDVTVKNSLNKGAVTLAPKSSGNGMKVCGLGGIVGWVRAGGAIALDNCDNEGNITLSSEYVTSKTGTAAYAICTGGVVGIAAPQNTDGYLSTPSETNGFDIALSNCDNKGTVYNCASVYVGASATTKKQTNKRVFTGGLAGSLLGKAADYASLVSCTNTGEVYTYDLTGTSASSQPCYSSVTGGFIGFGGYLDMDDCTVNCTMGNGKRPVMSYGGVIGCAVRPFNLKNSDVFVTGFYQRVSNYQGNRAVVAAVPVLFGTTASNTMNIAPDIKESTITDCNIGASVKTSESALTTANGEKTDDCSGSLTTTIFKDSEETQSNLVCGQGYTTVETDVTVTGFNYWDGQ